VTERASPPWRLHRARRRDGPVPSHRLGAGLPPRRDPRSARRVV